MAKVITPKDVEGNEIAQTLLAELKWRSRMIIPASLFYERLILNEEFFLACEEVVPPITAEIAKEVAKKVDFWRALQVRVVLERMGYVCEEPLFNTLTHDWDIAVLKRR